MLILSVFSLNVKCIHRQFWKEMFQVYYIHTNIYINIQPCGAGRFGSVSTGVRVFCLPGVTVALDCKDLCFLFNLHSWETWRKL